MWKGYLADILSGAQRINHHSAKITICYEQTILFFLYYYSKDTRHKFSRSIACLSYRTNKLTGLIKQFYLIIMLVAYGHYIVLADIYAGKGRDHHLLGGIFKPH
ncbi:hypothetical protein IMSAGC004_01577 [Bacteroidaceae bacterium]|nr:hypothetical protein IMSAGC004_01577 [Bacteroidaceae bacterium]